MRRKNNKYKQFNLNGARINSVCISKITQNRCVTGDSHNNIRQYYFDENEESFCFNSSNNNTVQSEVSAISYNFNDKQVYAGSNRGIIHIWDIEEGKQINFLKGHSTSVNCFGIFYDELNRMASGSYDTNIKLWDIRDKNNYATLKGHTNKINSINISPDCSMLVSASEDNSCKIWDLRYPEKIVATYNDHTAPVLKVLFHPDNKIFASSSMDKTAKYYKCQAPNQLNFVSSTDLMAMPVTAIVFDGSGKLLYTAANDTLKVWNMGKGGMLIETIESQWKGVQQICWTKDGLLGVAAGTHHLSFWAFDFHQKLIKKTSQKRQSDSIVLPNINKKNDVQKDLLEALNNINDAIGVVNNLQKQKKEKFEEKQTEVSQEQKLAKLQQQKLKAQVLEQEKIQKQRKRQEQLKKQKQEKQKLEVIRRQEERKKLQKLEIERIQRQKILQKQFNEALDEKLPYEMSMSIHPDNLQSSSINLSAFIDNETQKQKLKQIQSISEMMNGNSTFKGIMSDRFKKLNSILFVWSKNRVDESLKMLKEAEPPVVSSATTAILKSSIMRYAVSPEVAVKLLIILEVLMKNKHGTFFYSAMVSINQIVKMFKQDLIKIKMFNPMTKNDPTRQERLAKYDRLIEQFLNIFKQERLKRYAQVISKPQNEELCGIAKELYTNLQDVLKKIMPRKEPEPA